MSPEDFWRVQLEAVYQRRNAHKLSNIPSLLEKYKGKEMQLYVKVCKTYDLDPSKFYTDPAAWEQYEKDAEEDVSGEAGSSGDGTGGAVVVPSLFGVTSIFNFGAKPEVKLGDEKGNGGSEAPATTSAKAPDMPSGECKTQ